MIIRLAAVAFAAAASLSFVAVAQAEDIPATPMNHGPMMMRGMGPVGDIFNLGMTPMNVMGRPVLDATGAATAAVAGAVPAEPAAAAAPMMHHRHHHHHHHMMKKKMMKKAM